MSEVLLDTQLVHSPCSSAGRGSVPSPCCLQWVDTSSGVGPQGAAELSQCAGPFTPVKVCWPQGSTLCALLWCLPLSLLHSGSTTSQGMFQHATNSRTRPMSMLLDQRGRIRERGREGGNPEKKNTQRDSGCFGKWACTAFTFNAFNSWSHCERMHQDGYCLWHSESRFSYKRRAWKV